jgi:hypothetical protein
LKNWLNLGIKYLFSLAILAMLIPVLGRATWTQVLAVALVFTLSTYVVGDLWILPKAGNYWALLADFGMAAFILKIAALFLPRFVLHARGVFIIALVITVIEWLFHFYLLATHAFGKETKPEA